MTAPLTPLREIAKKWRARRDNLLENSKFVPSKELNMMMATAGAWEKAADELEAFCDAAEAWIEQNQFPITPSEISSGGVDERAVRAALIGEKK